jgi:transposase-like protein
MAQHNQHGKQPPSRCRREFTPEFKRDAVELVRATGRPIAQVAAELGIWDSTLGNWVRQAQIRTTLRRHGLDPAPRRASSTWQAFLCQQAAGIIACDFFTVDTVWLRRL